MTDENGADNGSGAGGSLPGEIIEPIAIASLSSISGQASSLANLTYSNTIANTNLTQQNTVANQQAMNEVAESVLGKTVNLVANLNPLEAVAATKLETGNDIAQQVMDLKAAINDFKRARMKPIARIVPPPITRPLKTHPNPAGGSIVTAAMVDFPINLVFPDDTGIVPPKLSGGTQLKVDRATFPLEIRVAGQLPKPVGTIADVSRQRFPFTVNIIRATASAIKEESTQGPSTLEVPEANFPLRINLTA